MWNRAYELIGPHTVIDTAVRRQIHAYVHLSTRSFGGISGEHATVWDLTLALTGRVMLIYNAQVHVIHLAEMSLLACNGGDRTGQWGWMDHQRLFQDHDDPVMVSFCRIRDTHVIPLNLENHSRQFLDKYPQRMQ